MAGFSNIGLLILVTLLALIDLGETETKDQDGKVPLNIVGALEENALADSVNSFGYKLLMNMMADNEDKNFIISPTGISGLLAMTLLGVVGRSYDELADTLGFSQDVRINRNNHEQFGNLLKALSSDDTASKTLYADAVFIDNDSKLRRAYSSYLARVYNGEAITVDFGERTLAKALINEWVSNHTNNKIKDFIQEPLPSDTKAVLLSALYFNGQWKYPFTPNYTMQMAFKRSNGEVMTDLMLNFAEFNFIYSIDDDLQMIALPYNDSVTTLYALKPRRPESLSLAKLLQGLDYKKIDRIIDQMTLNKVIVRFPKMDLRVRSGLEDSIKSLGVRSIFVPQEANFALMIDSPNVNRTEDELITKLKEGEKLDSKNLRLILDNLPNPGVYVDSIIHDVKLSIDEYGTEAVAATSGILARTAELFYADSPFYMFIRNEKTKLVTFSAIINDPTA